jgi:ADP-heptose:LPS heptosyltransferase
MTPWNRFEQYFKHNQLRILQRWLGLAEIAPQQIDPNRIERILVVRQHDQLGDFLLSTPVFSALRNHFKGRSITVLARKYTSMLAQHHDSIDDIITFYEHGSDWTRAGMARLLQAIRNKFDLAVVLNTVSHSLSSDLLARFCCRTFILGSSHLPFGGTESNFFYNLLAPYQDGIRHQSERNLDILRYIGITAKDLHERICLTEQEKQLARANLVAKGWDPERLLIMVHPGAGKLGNRWPVDAFAEAANRLQQKFSAQIAVSWGPQEIELGKTLISQIHSPIIEANDRDLRKLAALFQQSGLFMCNDTGVMHLAASVGTSLVAVFGPTDPAQWKPWGEEFVAVRAADQLSRSVRVDEYCHNAVNLLKIKGIAIL